MLAYVYNGVGDLKLQDVPMPVVEKNNAVLKVEATSICGTDVRAFRFGSSKIKPPRIIGHEAVGTISHIGSDVSGFSEGDRVQIAPALGCGACVCCKKGYTNLCDNLKTIGFDFDGTFAEYMLIPALAFERGHVTRVPESVSSVEAVLAEPIACIVNAQEHLNIGPGDYVVVFGSGFIGTMHAQLAFRKGAAKVFMVEINEHRIAMARSVLPDLVIVNSQKENLVDAIRAGTDGHGADVAITACSVGSAQVDAMNIIAKRGRVSLFGGLPTESTGFIDSNIIHYKEVSVHGAHASTARQNREVLAMIAAGDFPLAAYTKTTFPLTDIVKAFEALNQESIAKAVLTPNSSAN